jgi:hypothetical protein
MIDEPMGPPSGDAGFRPQDPADEPPPDDLGEDTTEEPHPPGFDQLQTAAHEVISAFRAVLDVAEDLLHDPRTAEAVGSALSTVERAAGRAAATGRSAARGWSARQPGTAPGDHDDDDDDGDDGGSGVQRIPVS